MKKLNDLSNCKEGDYIWTIADGWTKVTQVCDSSTYPIGTNRDSYTMDGKSFCGDEAPVAFTDVPEFFKEFAEPKPCDLKKGDKVIVGIGHRRYFSQMDHGKYWCFADGCDEWSSNGRVTMWDDCKKWEE